MKLSKRRVSGAPIVEELRKSSSIKRANVLEPKTDTKDGF